MSGLRKIAKAYGGMVINGKKFVWDYALDKAVPESDMPFGSEQWLESERVRWCAVMDAMKEDKHEDHD